MTRTHTPEAGGLEPCPTQAMIESAAAALAVEWYCHPGESDASKAEAATQWRAFEGMARVALIAAARRAPSGAGEAGALGSSLRDTQPGAEGAVLVPINPTEDMLMAARGLIMAREMQVPNQNYSLGKVASSGYYGDRWGHILTDEERAIESPLTKAHLAQLIYRAMVSAAPPTPTKAGERG